MDPGKKERKVLRSFIYLALDIDTYEASCQTRSQLKSAEVS